MCLGGGGGRMSAPKREYQNRPVTVSGEQTGVDDPKDTAKATETLKIKRQKEEGARDEEQEKEEEEKEGEEDGKGAEEEEDEEKEEEDAEEEDLSLIHI